ncbi:MAG: FHA domain-containing protein [Chloroflexota bacterium]
MESKVQITIMSGVEDGTALIYDADRGDGEPQPRGWVLTVGRKDENDICLRNDTYVSRRHANLIRHATGWQLEDLDSTNGSFIENADDFFADIPVTGTVPIQDGQLFRVGRTWLRIQLVK